MKRLGSRLPAAAAAAAAILLTVFSSSAANGVRDGIRLCVDTLIPSLFPCMIAASYLSEAIAFTVGSEKPSALSRLLFGLSGGTDGLILCSVFGGYPTGERLTSHRTEAGAVTRRDGNRISLFGFFPAPAFAVAAVGRNMFSSVRAGTLIYGSVLLCGILCGIMISFPHKKELPGSAAIKKAKPDISAAVNDAARGMLGVCLWTVVYSAMKSLLTSFLGSEPVALSCIAEVTAGCLAASRKNDPALAAAVLSFGGLCVHLQVLPYLKKTGCKYRRFLLFRICHAALSFTVSRGLMRLFPNAVCAFSPAEEHIKPALTGTVGAVTLLLLCCFLVLDTAANAFPSPPERRRQDDRDRNAI